MKDRACFLVVDDEPIVGVFLQSALRDIGIDSRYFECAASALEASQEGDFAAAIVDLGLPDMPGDQLALKLRVFHPELPIVLATGYDEEMVEAQLLNDIHVRLLKKPFDEAELIEELRALGIA